MFSLFSQTSDRWTKVVDGEEGSFFYIDFNSLKKYGGIVYYWDLQSFVEPDKDGDLSYITYRKGDCIVFRYKKLSVSYFKKKMGKGLPSQTINREDKEWHYYRPNTVGHIMLTQACSR